MQAFESEEQQILEEEQRLDQKFQERLSKIDINDITTHTKIYGEYYAEIDKLRWKKLKGMIKSGLRMFPQAIRFWMDAAKLMMRLYIFNLRLTSMVRGLKK
jgi:hypothetical protein